MILTKAQFVELATSFYEAADLLHSFTTPPSIITQYIRMWDDASDQERIAMVMSFYTAHRTLVDELAKVNAIH